MKMVSYLWLFILMTVMSAYAQTHLPELIVNGSFEQRGSNIEHIIQKRSGDALNGYPYYNEQGQATGDVNLIPAGNKGIVGWQIDSGNIDLVQGWPASDGTHSIDLNGSTPAVLSQTIETQPGTLYKLSFNLSANPGGLDDVSRLRVIAGEKSKEFSIDRRNKRLSYDDLKYENISF